MQQPRASWRTWTGLVLFIVSICWPVLIPILLLVGAPAHVTATLSGIMMVTAELLLLVGAAIAGKEGFALIKANVFGMLKPYLPPQQVGRPRYMIGLTLFSISLVFGWASPYLGHHLPGFERRQLFYAVAGDIVLLTSLFVLGGSFWDKLRALFRYDVEVYATSKTEMEAPTTEPLQ